MGFAKSGADMGEGTLEIGMGKFWILIWPFSIF